jgi:hypothetical protein
LASVQFLNLGDDNLGVLEISEWRCTLKKWLARHGMVFMLSLIGIRELITGWMQFVLWVTWLNIAVHERMRGEAVGAGVWKVELIRVYCCVLQR